MLALVLAMLFCVAIGAGVVGYVMLEARREGRGGFWTAEGEELIAGARRTGEKVRTRGGQLGRTAAERTRDLAAKLPEAKPGREADGEATTPGEGATSGESTTSGEGATSGGTRVPDVTPDAAGQDERGADGYRAAS